jgi:hypothetical protein
VRIGAERPRGRIDVAVAARVGPDEIGLLAPLLTLRIGNGSTQSSECRTSVTPLTVQKIRR